MKQVILINGVPASGKSTVSALLTAHLLDSGIAAVPLGLDTIKEGLFAQIGTGDRDHNRMLGRASYHAIFNTVATFDARLVAVIDAWHGFQPEAVLRGHLERAGVGRVIEVWCRVSGDIAGARYAARAAQRHAGHLPASYAEELRLLAQRARPLAIGAVIEVDTQELVGPGILAQVQDLLAAPAGAAP